MPFELDDIKNDRCFKDFTRSRNIRDRTKGIYATRIKVYSNFTKKTPTEMIEQAEKEEKLGTKLRNREINDHFYDFRNKLEEDGKSPSTINGYFDTVKAFYRQYDIQLPKLRITSKNNDNWSIDEIPTIDHVREAVKVSNLRDKAIILLMLSSGMGSGEIRHLKYEDFINSITNYLTLFDNEQLNIQKIAFELRQIDNIIGTWKIHRFKTEMPHITFNSPESTLAIVDYLIEREGKNKGVKDLEDPLFVSSHRKQISNQGLVFIFRRINERAGFGDSKHGKRRFFTSHTLRKLFTITLYNEGLDQLAVNWMLGHKIKPVTIKYLKKDQKALKTKYLGVVENLTLEKVKVKQITTWEYDQLLRDSREKDTRIKQMEKELKLFKIAIEQLRKQQLNESTK